MEDAFGGVHREWDYSKAGYIVVFQSVPELSYKVFEYTFSSENKEVKPQIYASSFRIVIYSF